MIKLYYFRVFGNTIGTIIHLKPTKLKLLQLKSNDSIILVIGIVGYTTLYIELAPKYGNIYVYIIRGILGTKQRVNVNRIKYIWTNR